jgi:hypothetical protein
VISDVSKERTTFVFQGSNSKSFLNCLILEDDGTKTFRNTWKQSRTQRHIPEIFSPQPLGSHAGLLLHGVSKTPNRFLWIEVCSLAWTGSHHSQVVAQETETQCELTILHFWKRQVPTETRYEGKKIWWLLCLPSSGMWHHEVWSPLVVSCFSLLFPYLNLNSSHYLTLLPWIWRQYMPPKIC